MMNTPLVAFVVILGITWAEALPKGIDIVIGSRNVQSRNNIHIGEVPNNKTTNSSQTTYGSVTNQHDEKYFILGRANKTEVLTPRWYDENSEIPRSVIVSSDPDLPADRIDPKKQQKIQENLNYLTESCQKLKGTFYQALRTAKNQQTIINLIQDVIKIELNLQSQQKSLDQFNYVLPLTQSKHDDFDSDLRMVRLEIEKVMLKSLSIIEPKN